MSHFFNLGALTEPPNPLDLIDPPQAGVLVSLGFALDNQNNIHI